MSKEREDRWQTYEVPTFSPTDEYVYDSKLNATHRIFQTSIQVKRGEAAPMTVEFAQACAKNRPISFKFVTAGGYTEEAIVLLASTPAPDPNINYEILDLAVALTSEQAKLLVPLQK